MIKRATLALAALSFGLVLTLAVSPAVRASLATFLGEIGGVVFNETSVYPNYSGTEAATLATVQTLSLDEAQAVLPFSFGVPTWMPEGFVMDPIVRITYFTEGFTPVSITFKKPRAEGWVNTISLMVGQTSPPWVIAPNSAETISVNGQEAALIQGGWNSQTQRWGLEGLTLAWTKEGVFYQLLTWANVSKDELILIAASIP